MTGRRLNVLSGSAVRLAVVLLGAAAAAAAAAASALDLQDYGLYTLVLNSDLLKCTFNKSLGLDVSQLKLYMYDFENDVNSSYYLNQSAAAILADPAFNRTRKTLLWLPGFTETIDHPNQDTVRSNLKAIPNSYLYIVDHHAYTNNPSPLLYLSSYERSVKYYWDIGRATSDFLADLVAGGVDSESVLVMGHSLGGQMTGAVGEAYVNRTGKLLPRIKASDPAGPCFSKAAYEFQLRSGLARDVVLYHCNAGQLGTDKNLADASYYANGGEEQPSCRAPQLFPEVLLSALASNCSHNTCPTLVTLPARLPTLWQAAACDSLERFQSGECADGLTDAGFSSDADNSGTYYFDTTGFLNT